MKKGTISIEALIVFSAFLSFLFAFLIFCADFKKKTDALIVKEEENLLAWERAALATYIEVDGSHAKINSGFPFANGTVYSGNASAQVFGRRRGRYYV